MQAFVIKGWDSRGNEFFVAHIERGDGCWSEPESLADAQLFSSLEDAERNVDWLNLGSSDTFVVKSVTVDFS